MPIRTVPELLAEAHGIACEGPHPCFFCGAPCDGSNPVGEHVKDSFTGRSGVVAPGSPGICNGCVLSLRDSATIDLLDGTRRHCPRIAMRGWSWLITRVSAEAGNKSHMTALRRAALEPPEPPWALVLSDSGQKHLIYRGAINHGGESCTITLETERIGCTARSLRDRLALTSRLVAATGKPALAAPITVNFAVAVVGRYRDGETLLETWGRVRDEPLSRLAAWLSPAKEDAQIEWPSDHA